MTQGITKELILTGTKSMTLRVKVTETYDLLENRSDVTVFVEASNSVYAGHTYYLSGAVTVDGVPVQTMDSVAGTHYVTLSWKDTYYPISGQVVAPWQATGLEHGSDGRKTVTVGIDLRGVTADGRGASGWTVTGEQTVELTEIPRASGIAATDANIGAVSMIAIHRKNSAFTHTVAWEFGQLGGYLGPDGSMGEEPVIFSQVSVPFRLPEVFYSQIPNARTGLCRLTCRTFREDTQVGEDQHTDFTVTAPQSLCGPVLEVAVSDGNPDTLALTGSEDVLVRYRSLALCQISAQARMGAAIVSKTVDGQPVTGDSHSVPNAEQAAMTVTATDSRGYTTAVTVEKTMIPYVNLTCNLTARRTDPVSGDGELTVSGECFQGSFGLAENQLTLQYRVGDGQWQPLQPQFEGNRYSVVQPLTGLHYAGIHQLQVQAQDCLSLVSKTTTVNKGIPVFHWGEADFTFQVPVNFLGGLPAWVGEGAQRRWLSPPMEPGVEYRTMGQHRGAPLYTQLLDCGFFPANAVAGVEHGIPIRNVVDVRGGTEYFGCCLPYFDDSGDGRVIAEVTANRNLVLIRTATDNWTGHRCWVQLWYTKEETEAQT